MYRTMGFFVLKNSFEWKVEVIIITTTFRNKKTMSDEIKKKESCFQIWDSDYCNNNGARAQFPGKNELFVFAET